MRRRRLAMLVMALGLVASSASAGEADTNVERARDHFKRGVELFQEGDYSAALIDFKRADELAPNFRIQYNLGQIYFELRDYVRALAAFERYLVGAGAEITAERRREVEIDLAKLRTRVGSLIITVNVQGAKVFVDSEEVGTTPLTSPVLMNQGSRVVVVKATDFAPSERRVELSGGEKVTMAFDLVPAGSAAAPGETIPHPVVKSTMTLGAPFWIGAATTAALGIGTAVVGVMALDARSSLDDQIDSPNATARSIDAARDQARTLGAVTDVLGASAIVSAGVTVVLAMTTSGSRSTAVGAAPGGLRFSF